MPSSQDKMPAILQANVLSPDVNSIDTSNELDDEPTDFRSAQYSNSPYLNPPPASMPPAYHSNISPSLPIEFQEQNDIPNFSEADQHDSLDNHAIIFHAQNDLNPHKTFNPETSTNSADQNISSETDSSQLQHRYSPLYQDELLSQWQQIIDGQSEIISQINNFSNSLNQHSHTSSISESLSSLEQKIQSISKVLMPLEQKIQSLSEIHQLQYESFFQQVEQINRSVCSIQDELRSQNSYAVLQDILLLYDFIDLRLNSVPAEHSTNSRSREILAIRSRILELLRRQNLFPIEVTDHHFDPSSQRILQEISTQNPQEDGLISRIFRQGFRLGECVFRPTEVEIKRYQAND
jgi:molecular chaperone GrpE (heat shock protein)